MEWSDRLRAMFEQAGLPYASTIEKVPNSKRALMVGELARDRGRLDVLHPRLFDAYWARGRDIGDERVLIEEGAAAGLDESEIADAVNDERYRERIAADTAAALDLGAVGVPAWLIDRELLVPGAQPHEVFERVLARVGYVPAGNGRAGS
jgi:predicted DsbA family dithiol-disulfide isomerase